MTRAELRRPHAVGSAYERVEGRDKVVGAARYAAEFVRDEACHGWIVGSTVARGRITEVDTATAAAVPGVIDVLWHGNAHRLTEVDDAELMVLQDDRVQYHGRPVAVVIGRTLEAARAGAAALRIDYDVEPFHVQLSAHDPDLVVPDELNAGFPTDTESGDVEAGLTRADVVVDQEYRTPHLHNVPMEPHATTARWDAADQATVYDSTQNSSEVSRTAAQAFGLGAGAVTVHSEHVGGGFGSKGTTRPNVILALLAARLVDRPVTVTLTREMTFHLVGYRTPTIQRVRLGATAAGRLTAIVHETVEQSSRLLDFAEQTGESTRHMYAAPARRVTHRLSRLDVPTPRWLRAPGEAPGMFAVEAAMDELAEQLGLDPVELRIANEPETDPDSGLRFSSRHYVECLREGARLFGWSRPRPQGTGPWRVGRGVAGSTYPAYQQPSSARATARADGTFDVEIAAADIGTGARTVLRQIAADALQVPIDRVRMHVGSSALPQASGAGGSSGTASWGRAVTRASEQLCDRLTAVGGAVPFDGLSAEADTTDELSAQPALARFAYGAQFVEARVNTITGEVRVPRALGTFAVGRVVNPRLARSQLIGGMTMGLSMALLEEGRWDPAFGDTVNDNFADYHIAANADIGDIDVHWLDEQDDHLNPMGSKGIGEIGIVGTAAAVTAAVHDAVGVRIRDLPVRLDKVLAAL
ncbi:molybdopterin-dependent oxidoreductase [Nakamurella sp. YIM 132087]|uniref:Molybdopterin-dependent oxidoreductase n=1 Tax=Nakamurella alba TaxID=2665158 RepID=A0A7K1FL11_9ACTN|nr:xanthine dehydrogenase family protein molybdopterin-binding subunit [Nakamurella alba]MTD14798.1 molybdopterin-dependent oxidoreductase [Nakamurella alba]